MGARSQRSNHARDPVGQIVVRARCVVDAVAATSCSTTLEANDPREESRVVKQVNHSRIDRGQQVPSILSILRTAAYLRARGQCGSLLMCFDIIAPLAMAGRSQQTSLIAVVWAVFLPLLSRLWLWSGLLETRAKIEVQVWVSLGCA